MICTRSSTHRLGQEIDHEVDYRVDRVFTIKARARFSFGSRELDSTLYV